ncbi:DUF5986 family protein [Evansella cellulosilytica]|uniref:Uncharacterized protein n=1 Tax=Evansella cellulosilytica (strain ATCC 21833 / DSM 2522 / FERM P-1141 / JCM 9156 / N-4) TaxID=649639 RepID=E6TTD8_EVAC2|nr:DUF5986 family protein [Evansella cellulosilytica]ADU28478.1 hypothetical protein Bcell_0189 [Evansella cellulosilytica DSM 2522]
MINLHNDIVKAIVNILVMDDPEARLLYLQSINNVSGEGTQNSSPKQKWDYRYNSLIEMAKKYELRYFKLDRGKLWEAVLIAGPQNELYVFFSHKNMKNVIKKGKNNHYLKLLNLFNHELDELKPIYSQMTLPISFEDDDDSSEDLIEQAREMLSMMEEEPSKVYVFAFDHSFVTTVKAFAYNTRQEVVWERDLTELIEPNYRLVLTDDEIYPDTRISNNTPETKKEKKQIVSLKNIK